MRTTPLAVVLSVMLIVAGVAAVGATPTQDDTPASDDGIADLLVGDLVIGEDEQPLGPMRVAVADGTEQAVVEIDLAPLEAHGVDVDDAGVEVADDDVMEATLESATVEDGVVRLVFTPEDTAFAVEEIRLTGLDTSGAEAASGVEFDVEYSGGEGRAASFDLVDPDAVTPTLSPGSFLLNHGDHRVTVEDVQPAADEVTVELDVTALESHGIGLDGLTADASAEKATVDRVAVEDGVVTVVVSPDADAALIDVRVEMDGFDASGIDTGEDVYAEDVAYEVSVDGDADDEVDVETFDLVAHTPTPVYEPDPSSPNPDEESAGSGSTDETTPESPTDDTPVDVPLGVAVPVAGLVLAAWLTGRRRNAG